MNELNAAARQGMVMIMGGLACLAGNALLGLISERVHNVLGAAGPVAGILSTMWSFLVVGLALVGYGLFIAGSVTVSKGVNATSKNLLLGTIGLTAIALVLQLAGFIAWQLIFAMPPGDAPLFLHWIGHYSAADAGFLLLALAVYSYFLISLDYSQAEFQQGMTGLVAPGRGFVFGMVIAGAGFFQLYAVIVSGHDWFGPLAVIGASIVALIGTYNRMPPAESPGPMMQPPPDQKPPVRM